MLIISWGNVLVKGYNLTWEGEGGGEREKERKRERGREREGGKEGRQIGRVAEE